MKNIFSRFFDALFGSDKAWWIEVKTQEPACTYYFGPFDASEEANKATQGYVEDLENEGAKQVQATVLHCKRPAQLTVYAEEQANAAAPKPEPVLSGQK